ncbi:MAG: LysM peptidoglycan-binding domain-containing protein [Akkermansia sp.]|nr:LysM peptidoglycan-binding domain-containing protein [Akkermansia sp.]
MKRQSSTFRNSDMARVKPKKHFIRTFINKTFKYHGNMGLVEDRHNSTTIVRLIVGLLLIHLIVIGGVILRGKIKSGEAGPIAEATLTAPPAPVAPATPAAPVNDVLPQPVDGPVANPVRTEVAATGHITQAPAQAEPAVVATEPEIVTPPVVEEVAVEPVETPAPVVETPAPAAPVQQATVKHLVATGDTLYGIAAQHKVTVAAIRKANPNIRNNNIICGTYLNIPVSADSAAGRQIAAQQAAAAATEAAKLYTIKRGDTLARIARKHKTTVAKLMQLNNIAKGNEGKIRVGDTLRIAN